jgi:hypothetical protein
MLEPDTKIAAIPAIKENTRTHPSQTPEGWNPAFHGISSEATE